MLTDIFKNKVSIYNNECPKIIAEIGASRGQNRFSKKIHRFCKRKWC